MQAKESLFSYFRLLNDFAQGNEDDLGRMVGIVVLESCVRYDRAHLKDHTPLRAVPSGQRDQKVDEMREIYAGFRYVLGPPASQQSAYSLFCELKAPLSQEIHRRGELEVHHRSILLPDLLAGLCRRGTMDDRLLRNGLTLCRLTMEAGSPQKLRAHAIALEDYGRVVEAFHG